MAEWPSGNELTDKWDRKGFELLNFVCKGLQPHDDTGQPVPSPEARQEENELLYLQDELRTLQRKNPDASYRDIMPPEFSSPRFEREFKRLFSHQSKQHKEEPEGDEIPSGKVALEKGLKKIQEKIELLKPERDPSENYEERSLLHSKKVKYEAALAEKVVKKAIRAKKGEIKSKKNEILELGFSWENHKPSDSSEERKSRISEVLKYLYKPEDVKDFEKRYNLDRREIEDPAIPNVKMRPNQKARNEARKIAKKIWDESEDLIYIYEMIERPEILNVAKEFTPRTRHRWICDLAPKEAQKPGRKRT